jgi:hypothetical protein
MTHSAPRESGLHAALGATGTARASSNPLLPIEHPRPPEAMATMNTTMSEASMTSRTVRQEAGTPLQAAPTVKKAAAARNVTTAQVTA